MTNCEDSEDCEDQVRAAQVVYETAVDRIIDLERQRENVIAYARYAGLPLQFYLRDYDRMTGELHILEGLARQAGISFVAAMARQRGIP